MTLEERIAYLEKMDNVRNQQIAELQTAIENLERREKDDSDDTNE